MGYGSRIKYHRERCGLYQSDIGKACGVSSQAVSKWELDKTEPDLDSVRKMCEIFSISANELMGIGDGASPAPSAADDDELWQLREQLRRDPERRILFDAAQKVRKEDILTAVRILDALKGGDDGDDI